MEQRIECNHGQVTQHGDIHTVACPGLHACPYDRGEDDYQRKFEENTGISCGKPARLVLQHLLDVGHFERKQLALAWRTKSLCWDWDAARLEPNVSRVESAYGYFLMVMGFVAFLAFMAKAVFSWGEMQGMELLQALTSALVFAAMTPFAEKYLVRPNRIARRAGPVIEGYYASARHPSMEYVHASH
jgi:hypothetical protein